MRRTCSRLLLPFLLAGVMALPGAARAQDDVSIWIEKHARLTSDGGVVFFVHIACGPLPGTHDFREALAGAGQPRTGAAAEGGISPDVVCDGVERVYTARDSVFTDEVFVRGPARAGAAIIACNIVGDDQVCIEASTERRIVISGRLVP